jgi:flagellar protein FlaI
MADNNIRSITDVGKWIHEYYKDPDEILEKIL